VLAAGGGHRGMLTVVSTMGASTVTTSSAAGPTPVSSTDAPGVATGEEGAKGTTLVATKGS
jgi:hypothetical protein